MTFARTLARTIAPRRLVLATLTLAAGLHCRRAAERRRRCSTRRTTCRASSTRTSTTAFIADWKKKTGETVDDQPVARRLDQAGARRRQRPRSRRRHLQPGARHRRSGQDRRHRLGRLAQEVPQRRLALHDDLDLPRPQGQPEGHQGLGRSRQARHRGDRSQPEDLRQRPLHLPRRLGLRPARRPATRRAPRSSSASCSPTCRCSTAAAAAPPRPSPSATRATCSSPSRTRPALIGKEFGADKFEVVYPEVSILAEPPVAIVDKVVDKRGTPQAGRGLPQLPLFAGRSGDHRQARPASARRRPC